MIVAFDVFKVRNDRSRFQPPVKNVFLQASFLVSLGLIARSYALGPIPVTGRYLLMTTGIPGSGSPPPLARKKSFF
jgi:hypothetical protein